MVCQRCESKRIVSIYSKSSDCNFISMGMYSKSGYMDLGEDSDGLDFEWCLECGQIQGEFPLPFADIERGLEKDATM